jgi:hypothetical protein
MIDGADVDAAHLDTANTTSLGAHRWWEDQYLLGEYKARAQDQAPAMPRHWAPGQLGAGAGGYTPRRMMYRGDGVEIRMPSWTSVRRFADRMNGSSFDVPVAARMSNGREVTGWVRCTRAADGRWATRGLSWPKNDEKVAEAVGTVLEARSPRLALSEKGAVRRRQAARRRAAGVELEDVHDSQFLAQLGHDPVTDTMFVVTRDGRLYGHRVPRETFRRIMGSDSKGSEWAKLSKTSPPRVPVVKCSNCGRFKAGRKPHLCPVAEARPVQPDPSRDTRIKSFRAQTAISGARPPKAARPPAPDPAGGQILRAAAGTADPRADTVFEKWRGWTGEPRMARVLGPRATPDPSDPSRVRLHRLGAAECSEVKAQAPYDLLGTRAVTAGEPVAGADGGPSRAGCQRSRN